jgi:hypothetical protein
MFAQDTVMTKTKVTDEPLWLLILPSVISPAKDNPLEYKLTEIATDIAWSSGRFEVFDIYDAREYLTKYQSDKSKFLLLSDILAVGDSLQCDEVLIVELLNFSQVGVPPPEDEDEEDRNIVEQIIDGIFSGDSDDYSDNIHSRLSVQFRNIDLASGEEIDRFSVNVAHTGGTRPESEEQVFKKYYDAVYNEVRMLYQLVSEVVSIDGVEMDLRLGSNIGISGNTMFQITEPDIIKLEGDEEVIYPGETAGLACVRSVGDTINRSLIIRQWKVIEPGYYAYEYDKNIHGIQLYVLPNFPEKYLYIGGQFHYSPLGTFDFGGGIRYLFITDSYDSKDHGLGFGIFGGGRIFRRTALTMQLRLSLDIDIPFRQDDDGRTVKSGLFSGALSLSSSFMLSKKADLELNLGYRLSTKSSNWTYSEEEEEWDAFWYDTPPEADISGIFFTVGYKFLLF